MEKPILSFVSTIIRTLSLLAFLVYSTIALAIVPIVSGSGVRGGGSGVGGEHTATVVSTVVGTINQYSAVISTCHSNLTYYCTADYKGTLGSILNSITGGGSGSSNGEWIDHCSAPCTYTVGGSGSLR